MVLDPHGRVLEWTTEATSLFDRRRVEMLGRDPWPFLLPSHEVESQRRRFTEIFAAPPGRGERTFEDVTMLIDGREVPVVVRATRLGTTPPHLMLAIRAPRSDEAEGGSWHELSAIVEHAEDAMAMLAIDGTITRWNAAAERLYGYTAEEVVGKRMAAHVVPEGRAHEPGELLMAVRRGAVVERETTRLHKNGEKLWVSVRMLPVRGDDGRVTGSVWIARDVTDRHRLEEREQLDAEALRHGRTVARALAEDLFVFAAQPVIDLADRRLDHYELLLRMRGNDGGLVMPGGFLPQAERSGQIVEIDLWAVRHGIELAARAPVAINISAASIARGGLIEEVEARLAEHAIDPARVTFEITETAAAEDIDRAAELIEQLGAIGCQIALDDFGTGFGTFTYLSRLAVGELKIDREFVRQMHGSDTDQRVILTMISVARNFGMRTVAEGIEDPRTLAILEDMGVDLGQGYFFGRPTVIDDAWGEEMPGDGGA